MSAQLIEVMTKARKFHGTIYPSESTKYMVEVVPGKSISIFRHGVLCNSFMVGDLAAYGSYNLIYDGTITAITLKGVTIVDRQGTCNEKVRRLDFNEFCWRNEDYDAAQVAAHNAEEMMCI